MMKPVSWPCSEPAAITSGVSVYDLGSGVAYEPTWRAMQRFTDERDSDTGDQIWLLQHEPVFTLGQNGRREHLLAPGDIPVIDVDRGGQVTYHGPGQLVAYPLIDLRRRGIGVRRMVTIMETTVIQLAADNGIKAQAHPRAPGVYVGEAKLAAVGLRVRRGCSYHGLALNVAMDLSPFARIDPCGYHGMPVTDLRSLGADADIERTKQRLADLLTEAIGSGA